MSIHDQLYHIGEQVLNGAITGGEIHTVNP